MNEKFIENIRKDLGIENFSEKDNFSCIETLEYNNLDKCFNKEEELVNPNNIYINYCIGKNHIEKGIEKTIKLKRIVENNKTEQFKFNFKIPANIQNSQKIIFYGEGNRKNGIIGNLILEIIVK